jgi:Flp pilus assembly protein TadD
MLTLTTLLVAAIVAATPALADDMQDASRLYKAGQAQQALERVNRVLAGKPRDPQARFLKGVILTEQGNTKEAIDIFTRLTQDYPDLPEPYNNLAVIHASQGQYDRARATLEQAIRTHPSYATAYENLGDVYAKLASQAYGKALQLDASNTGAQNKLSLVRELVGPASKAEAAKVDVAKVEAPKAEKPKPLPEKPPVVAAAPAADPVAEILKAVDDWAKAWSSKDADAYLAFYAKDFRTPGQESRAEWEKARRARIAAPKSIAVTVASPRVSLQADDQASVSFRQTYAADVFKGSNNKTLVLVKVDGRWQIREEKTGS